MLKALLLSLTTTALAGMATAQINLVPNPSFEDATICDSLPPQEYEYMLGLARPWFSPNTATPDIYDCDLDRRCGVPMDPDDLQGVMVQGFQLAQHGDRFAGAYQWFGPGVPPEQDTREYLMIRLTAPLVGQQTYRISLWYSRAEGYSYAIDHIGVHFGMDSISVNHPTVLEVMPQVHLRDPLSTYLAEGNAWVYLADTFIATGGEQWMTIGTFEGSDQVDGIEATPSSYPVAYYYFDAISVEPLDGTGIEEWNVWYAGGDMLGLDWQAGSPLEHVCVMDLSGRVVVERSFRWQQGGHALGLPHHLTAGLYIVEGISAGRRWVAKFVKEE